MKAFTFSCGKVYLAIKLRTDERFGQVVFLGEEGRGRRYEKVALGKRNPAEVIDGRVHAHVTLSGPEHALGSHLEEGCTVLTFSILVLADTPDADLAGWDTSGQL